LRKIETELDGEQQLAWRPKVVYHYIQWNIEPDFVVDITGFTDKKIESILAYGSQFYDKDSKEPESPITSKNFLESELPLTRPRSTRGGRLCRRFYCRKIFGSQ
jgi:LmbE family N-acetylglucosaminyl deacetylase